MEHIKIIVEITLPLRLSFTLKSFFTPKYWLSMKEIWLKANKRGFSIKEGEEHRFFHEGAFIAQRWQQKSKQNQHLSWNSFDHQKEVSSHVYSHYTCSFSFAAVRCWPHQPRGEKLSIPIYYQCFFFCCQVLISHWAQPLNGKLPLFTLRSLPFADIFIVIPTCHNLKLMDGPNKLPQRCRSNPPFKTLAHAHDILSLQHDCRLFPTYLQRPCDISLFGSEPREKCNW